MYSILNFILAVSGDAVLRSLQPCNGLPTQEREVPPLFGDLKATIREAIPTIENSSIESKLMELGKTAKERK
jgi:hypothetical protein